VIKEIATACAVMAGAAILGPPLVLMVVRVLADIAGLFVKGSP